jgi:PhnO protein
LEAIHVRPAVEQDFDAIYQFVNELEDTVFDKDIQREIYIENAANHDHIYLIAKAHDIPVGFLSCHIQNLLHHGGRIGEIQEMYVIENVRNHGVGKLLLENLKEMAAAKHVIQLEVTSSFRREAAHQFYEREGFEFTHKKFVHKFLAPLSDNQNDIP